MQTILYGETKLLSLESFLKEEGSDPSVWKIKPRCPSCGASVQFFPQQIALRAYFGHKTLKEGENCPLNFKNLTQYKILAKHSYDVRAAATIRKALGAVQRTNRQAAGALWKALTKKNPCTPRLDSLLQLVDTKKLFAMEVLGENPWLLPYFLILTIPPVMVQGKNTAYRAFFRREGRKEVSYTSFDGEERKVFVPGRLRLYRINGGNRALPVNKEGSVFPLNPKAYKSLADSLAPRQMSLF